MRLVLIVCLGVGCSFDSSSQGLGGSPAGQGDVAQADAAPRSVAADGSPVVPVADAAPPDAPGPDADLRACASDAAYQTNSATGVRYRVSAKDANFLAARNQCVDDDAHLVIIDDAAEDAFVRSLSDQVVWIGATDLATEGTFLWVDGTPIAGGYDHWAFGQPDNGSGTEHCVELTTSGNWNDDQCRTRKPFICEC